MLLFALAVAATTPVARSGTRTALLEHRETRQEHALHRHHGTVVFFRNRPWLARTRPGRRALHVAHVWIPIIRRELAETRAALHPKPTSVPAIICDVFGAACSKALSVARCESGFRTWAQNGQYLGLFQMGDYARSRYGHGSDAWTQARAAYAYYRDAGWAPWECA